MRTFGRAMQVLGLTLPPVAIILQLGQTITAGQMLLILVGSVCAFWIGRIVEGYAPQ